MAMNDSMTKWFWVVLTDSLKIIVFTIDLSDIMAYTWTLVHTPMRWSYWSKLSQVFTFSHICDHFSCSLESYICWFSHIYCCNPIISIAIHAIWMQLSAAAWLESHFCVRINNSTIWWWFYAKQMNQDKARALPQSRLHRSPPWKQMNKLLPQCTLIFSSEIYAFLISPNIGLNGSALPQNGRLDHVFAA